MSDIPERNYLVEAREILEGNSPYQPERRHLEALQEHHDCQDIILANDLEALKRKVLGM